VIFLIHENMLARTRNYWREYEAMSQRHWSLQSAAREVSGETGEVSLHRGHSSEERADRMVQTDLV